MTCMDQNNIVEYITIYDEPARLLAEGTAREEQLPAHFTPNWAPDKS
ncbi:hypothetical protein [Ancylobacter oerskovii]|uniref:Uncharacterized protein n=1 Tax=Ancylobacter oerskovii TaxID=459519 RepID=A0ABW4YVG8_9HYPH